MQRCKAALPSLPLRHQAVLLLATCVAYANIWLGTFQFDDYNVIVNYLQVHSWQAWLDGLRHGIRPLLKLSYTLNWTSGWGVAGFHLLNLLIHLGNVLIVFELSCRFLRVHAAMQAHAMRIALFTALLFALHPVNTEAVTYVSGRSSALMTLFYLGGLLLYDAGRTRNDRLTLYLGVPLCFAAALTVKETAVTLPLALLVWELTRGATWRNALRSQWPYWGMLAFVALFIFSSTQYRTHMAASAGLNSLGGNLATQAIATTYLLRQWLLPLWLNIDPDLHLVYGLSYAWPQLVLLAALCILMLLTLRKRPWLSFALAWIVLQLLPLYLFLPRVDVANDRQMYLVSWPLALALVAESSRWLGHEKSRLLLTLLAIVLGALTLSHNRIYRSEIALWEDTVVLSPAKARVHNNLGYAYMLDGRRADAQREFRRALELDPTYYKARNNLLYLEAGMP